MSTHCCTGALAMKVAGPFQVLHLRGSMSRDLIETANLNVELTPCPIEPSWIIEGDPQATSCLVAGSSDGLGCTIVWHCTEGKFNWYYDFDETILILEGSIVLESDGLAPKRYGPGDVIFFRNGAHARWHVEGHVKKLAFCLKTQPYVLGLAIRAINKLKRMLLSSDGRRGTSLAGAN
jgi:uncharacterized cupin superfamily protein